MQNGQTLQWARTLRSRSPSPTNGRGQTQFSASKATDGRGSSPGVGLLSRSAERAFSARNGAARHHTEAVGMQTAATNEGYIAALQQQVHFLELDVGRLREQAQAATELHPKMTAEAEKMLVRLRELQTSADDLSLQLQHVEAEISQVTAERNILATRLESEISLRAKDKHMLANEVLLTRKGKEDAALEGVRKDSQLRESLDKNQEIRAMLRQIEEKNVELCTLLDQRAEQHCLALIALEEKVAHLALVSNHLGDTKRRYSESSAVSRDKTVSKLKAEVQLLRRALGIQTVSVVAASPPARTKQSTRALTLAEENDLLRQRVTELKTRLTMENNLRNSMLSQLEEETAEVAALYARTKALSLQVQQSASPRRQAGRPDSGFRSSLEVQNSATDNKRHPAFEANGDKPLKAGNNRASTDAPSPLRVSDGSTKQAAPIISVDKRSIVFHDDQQRSNSRGLEKRADVEPSLSRSNGDKVQNGDHHPPRDGEPSDAESGATKSTTAVPSSEQVATVAKEGAAQAIGLPNETENTGSAAEASSKLEGSRELQTASSDEKIDTDGRHNKGDSMHQAGDVTSTALPEDRHEGQITRGQRQVKGGSIMNSGNAEAPRQSIQEGEELNAAANSQQTVLVATGNSYLQIQMPAIDVRAGIMQPTPTAEPQKFSDATAAQLEVEEQKKHEARQAAEKEHRISASASQALRDGQHQIESPSSKAEEQTVMPRTGREAAQSSGRRRSLNEDLALVRQQQQHRSRVTSAHQRLQQLVSTAEPAAAERWEDRIADSHEDLPV